ncbi:MAG: hypothetical protein LBG60_07895 [Bifidobacteriaceae bacterium]|nr:hypothetical protein [Bifidobacteriaceae bacterium]
MSATDPDCTPGTGGTYLPGDVPAFDAPGGDGASIDTGAATTNGCLRVHMADLDALAALVPPAPQSTSPDRRQ